MKLKNSKTSYVKTVISSQSIKHSENYFKLAQNTKQRKNINHLTTNVHQTEVLHKIMYVCTFTFEAILKKGNVLKT